MSSSGGPSPPTTACRRTSPVSMYRLVKVSVKPVGRFGAPETEPRPSGMVVFEFMTYLLSEDGWFARHDAACSVRPEVAPGSNPGERRAHTWRRGCQRDDSRLAFAPAMSPADRAPGLLGRRRECAA